jgi:ubiquinone/menaquinone biosynthesis C-methylase UbiE
MLRTSPIERSCEEDGRFVKRATLFRCAGDANLVVMDVVRALIAEQIDYYRHRAVEYDETSRPPDGSLDAYGRELAVALERFRTDGEVLEIASGTGAWTIELLNHASRLTALDASPEMHEQARAKIGRDARVRFVKTDVFSWMPDARYDVVFFANWLSHVPQARFVRFWQIVARALRPSGRVFFIDELQDAWRHDDLREDLATDTDASVVRRSLRDGRSFRIVKVFWEPDALEQELHNLGWDVVVHPVGPFYWAEARRRSSFDRRRAWSN